MSISHRIRTLIVLIGLTAGGVGLTAGAAYGATASNPRTTDCVAHLTSTHDPGISLATSPPAGGEVAPGSAVTVTSRWDPDAWEELNKILLCVTSDGTFTAELSGGEKPADNDGEIVWTMTVPAAAAEGTELCVRSVIFGNAIGAPDIQKSGVGCVRVASVPPTTTTTIPAPSNDEPDSKVEVAAPEGPAPEPAVLMTAPEAIVEAQPQPLPELPRTGSAAGTLAVAGGAAVVAGGLALLAGRRKPSTRTV